MYYSVSAHGGVYRGYTTVMKFKEVPCGVMHSERNLNLNQAKPGKAHQHAGNVLKQASRPSEQHQTIMFPALIHVVH